MKKIIFIFSLMLCNNSYACEDTNFKTAPDDIAIWLGSNSNFSGEYIKGLTKKLVQEAYPGLLS